MSLEIAPYKPVPDTSGDANQVANGFQAIEDFVNDLPPANIDQAGATSGQALVWNGSAWVPTTIAAAQSLFRARRSTDQSIGNGATVKVQFATEDFDLDSKYDAATNYRYTPAAAGYYQLQGNIYFSDSWNDVSVVVSIYKNGIADQEVLRLNHMVDNDVSRYSWQAVVVSDADDYFEVHVTNNDATNRNVQGLFEGWLLRAI